ncbi:DinB family protein [Planococcus donghaensis]|uniref:DinB family protein n=1 Tax=Planococcus donghaensis TaxID=414778 RepID=UPI0037350DB0
MIDYRIISAVPFTEKIGELVSMLEYTRNGTLNEISGLTQNELDYLPDDSSNTIAALLLHMASIEFVHQVISNEKRDLTTAEYKKWIIPLELGDEARATIKNRPLEYYLVQLQETRNSTLSLLKSKQDSWLLEESQWENGGSFNNHYLWFHVMEDEISHRGQIRTLLRNSKR